MTDPDSTALHTAYLLLGSNIGERATYLAQAREALSQQAGTLAQASAIYETEAWGVQNQQPYLNQVLCLQTSLQPEELLEITQQIETSLGRTRHIRWEARVLDIDLLFYDNLILKTAELEVPHPRLHLRRFTLVPLAEIAPQLHHPVLGHTMQELLKECPDTLPVWPYQSL